MLPTKQKQRFDFILIAIALLSVFLNVYNIWNDQYANPYYTSAVTSMLQSFHNFFYASFDPAGYVTVDKPPVTFWVQTVFAYFLGVHGWSVILPQALAGVGSVLLMYRLVKPTFGLAAARAASLVMACTPIAVAVSRTNNVDSLLVFTLLAATAMLFKGIRSGKLAWILGASAMIGVAFNMKMLQAYMVVPAFGLFYLLAFKSPWKKKLAALALSLVLMVGVSVSWALVVDSIPQENRPYIGSSQTNSVMELAFGYNGVARLTGNGMGGGGGAKDGQSADRSQMRQDGAPQDSQQSAQQDGGARSDGQPMQRDGAQMQDGQGQQPPQNDSASADSLTPSGDDGREQIPDGGDGGPGGPGGRGGAFGTGQAGPLRLFQSELSGQASWLLPFVAFACIGLLAGIRWRKPLTEKQQETVFWLAWLLPAMAFFSVAGFFHHYYLIMLAPSIAALTAAGWVELKNQYVRKDGWKQWLLPAAVLVTTAFQLYVLYPYQSKIGIGWLIGVGAAGALASLAMLVAANKQRLVSIATTAGLLVLLVAPMYWALTPIVYGGNSSLPQAGPSAQGGFGGGGGGGAPAGPDGNAGGPASQADNSAERENGDQTSADGQRQDGRSGMNSTINQKLLAYVTEHNTGETSLFATTSSQSAAPYIIQTGKSVLALGGFSGSDPILTVDKVKEMVANHEVKFFLIPSGSNSGGPGGGMGNSEALAWVREHSTEIAKSEWQTDSSSSQRGGMGGMGGMDGSMSLYQINE